MSFLKNFLTKKDEPLPKVEEKIDKVYVCVEYDIKHIIELENLSSDSKFSDASQEVKETVPDRMVDLHDTYCTDKDKLIEYCYKKVKGYVIRYIERCKNKESDIEEAIKLLECNKSNLGKILLENYVKRLKSELDSLFARFYGKIEHLFDNVLPPDLFIKMMEELEEEYAEVFSQLNTFSNNESFTSTKDRFRKEHMSIFFGEQ